MPIIGWIAIFLAFALVIGSLFMLRGGKIRISPEKMKKIQKRKAEVEAEERAEEEDR
ncbi:MAG: DUF2897 family protein [Marinobacter sp.]|uniref:DUF2897 family protein n=1 Tax=Marinobacter sp. TaxID=50741 RepID=UPI0034A08960